MDDFAPGVSSLKRAITRRQLLRSAAAAALAATAAACAPASPAPAPTQSAPASSAPAPTQSAPASSAPAPTQSAPASPAPAPTQSASSSTAWSLEKAAQPYKGTTIRFIGEDTSSITAYRDIAVKEFTQRTGINVDFTFLSHPSDEQKAELDMSQNTGIYDIWNPDIADMGKAGAAGWFTPLDQFMNNKDLADPNYDLNDIFPDDLEYVCKYNGQLVALPGDHVVMLYVYNKKRLDAAGLKPPKTWDEFANISKQFTTNGQYGLATGLGRSPEVGWEFMGYLFNFGGDAMSNGATGKPTINTPIAQKMLTYWKDQADHYAPPGAKEWDATKTFDSLAAGQTTHSIFWTDTIDLVYDDPKSSKVPGEMAYDVPPQEGWGHLGSSSLCIPYSSKHKEAAFLFIQFASSKDMQMHGPPFAPQRASYYQHAKDTGDPRYARYLDTILKLRGHSKSRPLMPQWDQMQASLTLHLNAIFTGQATIEAGLQAIQKDWEGLSG